jgi:hypothetical protein
MINRQKQQQSTNEIRREDVASRWNNILEIVEIIGGSWEKSADTGENQQHLLGEKQEEDTTEDELRRVQLRRMEDKAHSLSRFIALEPSFKALRSGKNKARHCRDLRAFQRRRGQGRTLSRRLGMAWSSLWPWCPRHDKSKGLQRKPC